MQEALPRGVGSRELPPIATAMRVHSSTLERYHLADDSALAMRAMGREATPSPMGSSTLRSQVGLVTL